MLQRDSTSSYVLITPARNEASFIELTLKSVTRQTVKPLKWVIVSDGSTDGTDAIIRSYAAEHPWIELICLPERAERNFAGKVHAFNAGYEAVRKLDFAFLGSLDADISFEPDYFEFIIAKLAANPKLGLVGTPFTEQGKVAYDYRFVSVEHVSGACQFFRRECYEQVGGYIPMRGGGVDHVAVISARMCGWQTRSFPERTCAHHRKMGTAKYSPLRMKYHVGKLDYALGGHPLWELFRCAYQLTKPPLVGGGIMIFFGYFLSFARQTKRPIPEKVVRFRRQEQLARLRRLLCRKPHAQEQCGQ